ncbi:MAG: DUF1761 family protein [Caulobacterales bacterium]
MRFQGHNILAIAAAAIAIYFIEFLIYGLGIPPEQFREMAGFTSEQMASGMYKMPFGVVMPILTAIGLSLVIKWRGSKGAAAGVITALIIAILFGFGSRMYGYVYGPHTETYLAIDLARYLVTYALGGAIIGAWK